MKTYISDLLVSEVFKVLRQFKKRPLSLFEITFLTQSAQVDVSNIIDILLKANVVFKEDDRYRLNTNREQYNFLNAFE